MPNSMYETIMDFPLFKGVTREQLNNFIGKTQLEFLKFNDGEIIAEEGDPLTKVKFLISGEAQIERHNSRLSLRVKEVRPPGTMLAAQHVFGRDTYFPFKVTAKGRASIMQFPKDQLLNTLMSEKLYLLNYLNYLSLHSQKPSKAINLLSNGSLEQQIALWVATCTDTTSTEIELIGTMESLKRLTNLSEESIRATMAQLEADGIMEMRQYSVRIPSRSRLLDYAFPD